MSTNSQDQAGQSEIQKFLEEKAQGTFKIENTLPYVLSLYPVYGHTSYQDIIGQNAYLDFKAIFSLVDAGLFSLREALDFYLDFESTMSAEALEKLRDATDIYDELDNVVKALCSDKQAIKRVLSEHVLDKELVDKFNSMIATDNWCKSFKIRDIFELIEFFASSAEIIIDHGDCDESDWIPLEEDKVDHELLSLVEENRKSYLQVKISRTNTDTKNTNEHSSAASQLDPIDRDRAAAQMYERITSTFSQIQLQPQLQKIHEVCERSAEALAVLNAYIDLGPIVTNSLDFTTLHKALLKAERPNLRKSSSIF